jgi:hypothetical protein
MPLHVLHEVFQIAMGWWDSHLHDFEASNRHFGDMQTAEDDIRIEDERKFTLADLATKVGDKFKYEYDFGDCWQHTIIVEKELFEPGSSDDPYANCVAGKRACPPKDVGGTDGYRRFLEIIEDPEHDERDEMLVWAGGTFEPDSFDIHGVILNLYQLSEAMVILDLHKSKK